MCCWYDVGEYLGLGVMNLVVYGCWCQLSCWNVDVLIELVSLYYMKVEDEVYDVYLVDVIVERKMSICMQFDYYQQFGEFFEGYCGVYVMEIV